MTLRNSCWIVFGALLVLSFASACDAGLKNSSRLKIYDGGTSVGGGGDPIYYYLEVTRRKLNDVLGTFYQTPESVTEVCSAPSVRSGAQDFCRHFITATITQFAALNRGDAQTKFVLTSDPLLVEGPDGRSIEVVARTPYGSEGNKRYRLVFKSEADLRPQRGDTASRSSMSRAPARQGPSFGPAALK